jgi:Tfp pilus assembly protein PilO
MLAEKIIQINRSHRRVLLISLVVISAVAMYRWILSPYTGQLLAAQKYNCTLDSSIHKAGLMETLLEAKKAKTGELAKESDRLRNQLFTPQEARQFFASLPAAVRQTGCVTQSVSIVPETQRNPQGDGSGIVAKKATVTVIGGYNDIIKFLEGLQASEHKVWVESVRIDAGGAGKLKCQVLLTLYCIERVENSLYE